MALDLKPSTWLTGWDVNNGDITIPVSSFSELTEAEADAVSGDFRKVMFAWMEAVWDKYASLDTASKPEMMRISKSASINATTANITNSYTVVIQTSIGTQEVTDEA